MDKRFAKIENGMVKQVHAYYQVAADFDIPGLMNVTDVRPIPRSGWTYDAQTDTFTAPPPEPEDGN